MNPIRADIQALRGWAVALVVLYHAGLPGLPGGYLGVDLFFVLSGALITGLIRDAVDAGQFRCRDFYLRRARRLLPAALVTLTATTLAAAWVLDAPEWVDFRDQLAGTLAFSANWVLWSQTGYFEGAAELKPLLHMWSLALEEQYYLLLPPLLLALPRGHWRGAMLALTAVSALLCGAASRFDPSAAFYTLPCRAWELGLGSCVALAPGGGAGANPTLVQRHLLRVTACAVLAGVPLLTLPGPHPGWGAVWVAGATAVLLRWPPLQAGLPAGGLPSGPAGRAVAALRRTAASLLVGLGNRSYSLYLVHWPLFALLHNASLGAELPALWRGAAVLAALLLTEALHRGVERPLRHSPALTGPRMAWGGLAAAAAAWALVPLTQALWRPPQADEDAATHARRPNTGLSASCDQSAYTSRPECQTAGPGGAAPGTLVWGDSFAMHLVPGLAATLPGGLVQATQSTCAPLLGLAPLSAVGHTPAWAQACMAHNDAVLAHLRRHPELHTVVLASPFLHLLRPQDQGIAWQALWRDTATGALHTGAVDPARTEAALALTVATLQAEGRRVWLVAPPPMGAVDIGRCLQRQAAGRPVLRHAERGGCDIDAAANAALQAPTLAMLVRLQPPEPPPGAAAAPGGPASVAPLQVLRFEPWLCDDARGLCRVSWQGQALYRDARHLSHAGSVALAQAMDWGGQLSRPTGPAPGRVAAP